MPKGTKKFPNCTVCNLQNILYVSIDTYTVIWIFSKLEINIEMVVAICILNDSLEALSCGYLNQLRFLRWLRLNGVDTRQRRRGR